MISRLKFDLSGLVNEMLNNLPQSVFESTTTTFYDPSVGGGQFIVEIEKRLEEYGHSPIEISKRVFGSVEGRMRLNYITNINKQLVGDYRTKLIEDMKFDIIIGNPPYQDNQKNDRVKVGKVGGNLWSKFLSLADSWVNEDGFICFVTPTTWMSHNSRHSKVFKNNQILYLNVIECGKYFKGIGSDFSFYILKNTSHKTSTVIKSSISDEFTYELFNKFNFIPRLCSKVTFNILDKIYFNSSPKFSLTQNREAYSGDFKPQKIKTQYPAFHFKSGVWFVDKPHPSLYGKPKIIVGVGRGLSPIFDIKGNITPTENSLSYVVNSEEEGKNIIDFLNSKIVKFLILNTAYGSFLCKGIFKDLPIVPSNQNLYKYFNLTQEEIDLIEANIK